MKEELDASASLAGTVQELARAVVSALGGGDDRTRVLDSVTTGPDDPVLLAAARVLGADVLAPRLLLGQDRPPEESELVAAAARAFPPAASFSSLWNHWGMRAAVARARGTEAPAPPVDGAAALSWVATEPWQELTRRLAPAAALAGPEPSPLAAAVAGRTEDLARGFVRAVRRRDWLQAAGAGRWLALAPEVPASLGLDPGLEFTAHLGGADARVLLHCRAAALLRAGAVR
ncbi:hypothetical protein [Streptomyces physcomitrii]|uniref:Uncharacterized protein n=1 Tax=Streptomyces physcomitrii TaxID=2724184 RepID=A0ABX1HDU3_9ACTN|nr:hypothetical protein [Streptomyces physcomitrii]NKI45136.1 hypothetical protein [Streptomyces physcomitrii]